MVDKHYAFVDRKCEKCKGTGIVFKGLNGGSCPECQGTGMIGSYDEVPVIPMNGDKEFGDLLRKTRERRKCSLVDLVELCDSNISHISQIEMGMIMPTDKERKLLQEWIEQGPKNERN